MCVGRLTCSPADALRARPAICGALGRASVKSGAANQRSLTMSTPSIAKSRNAKSAGFALGGGNAPWGPHAGCCEVRAAYTLALTRLGKRVNARFDAYLRPSLVLALVSVGSLVALGQFAVTFKT
jgi:hypothetical protein